MRHACSLTLVLPVRDSWSITPLLLRGREHSAPLYLHVMLYGDVAQTVKARVLSADKAAKRLRLSLAPKSAPGCARISTTTTSITMAGSRWESSFASCVTWTRT